MPKGIYIHPVWNKGLTKDTDPRVAKQAGMKGKHHTEKTKEKMSKSMSGSKHPMYGKHHTKETRNKIILKILGNHFGGAPKGRVPWNKGIQNWQTKENNPNWRGGISKIPYPFEFNEKLKRLIRTRDNKICQLCNIPQCKCIKKLCIHHIDYNKENILFNNLISLCFKCNSKVNFNRQTWVSILAQTLKEA